MGRTRSSQKPAWNGFRAKTLVSVKVLTFDSAHPAGECFALALALALSPFLSYTFATFIKIRPKVTIL